MKRRNKYGNKKVKYDGITFDSDLEKSCYVLLKKFEIPFKFQVEFELQPAMRSWEGKAVRRIYMKIDFVLMMPDRIIAVDTKGFATEASKLKYKMLEYRLARGNKKYEIHWLKNKKTMQDFVLRIYDELKKR